MRRKTTHAEKNKKKNRVEINVKKVVYRGEH